MPAFLVVMSPHVQNCELHDGELGAVGSIVIWNYMIDGKAKVAKDLIEVIDDEKKLIIWKVIEGDLVELYNSFKITAHVETEKPHEDVEDPHTLMDLLISVTKDIESHHLQN
ncbi:Polyketide cyclase/dehydrase and lipid transportsuperfamily protein [Heracleum sosnowskyi]|uniref:Polyketide cyclase/dehydrase and lipid transportsuperfamily protein n=1 Tax=Heracleum sosnowskyi TaxID=360622 RepID=A0AAD8I8T2_9APIA|nr:Polyketide cyclase/dehydrase and lipid transportsuperfamily protein [Heracleum sosnowskyi]